MVLNYTNKLKQFDIFKMFTSLLQCNTLNIKSKLTKFNVFELQINVSFDLDVLKERSKVRAETSCRSMKFQLLGIATLGQYCWS